MNETETYKAKVYCSNCDLRKEIDIQKGKKVNETECPNCGTLELGKDVETTSYYNIL